MDLATPLIAAPMAGGAGTPAMVLAAARAGGMGFLAGGYATPAALAGAIEAVRPAPIFGVNLFVPNPLPVDRDAYRGYADDLRPDAERYGVELSAEPVEDDDGWPDKLDLLLTRPVPVVSFTFGIPPSRTVAAFRRAGTLVLQTVTSAGEATAAAEAGVEILIVQAATAGGHWGTLTPLHPPPAVPLLELLAQVRHAVRLPLVAAGGLAGPADVAAVLAAGASAAMVGTLLLRAEEAGTSATHRAALAVAGTSAVHRAALAGPGGGGTVVTRAFTGRPARALRNRFTDRYSDRAPYGYPAVHHLTAGLRRAAAAAGDRDLVHLWAGTGYRHAAAAGVAEIFARLAG